MVTPSTLRLAIARTYPVRLSLPLASLSLHQRTSLAAFHNSAKLAYPRKGSEDKDSINRESTEYSKSGTDDEAAAMNDAAFDPSKTSPEEQMETAGKESADGGSPLDVSPANDSVSKPRESAEGGAQSSSSSSGSSQSGRKRSSGQGSPAKSGKTG